jgi:urease accessory protein
MLSVVTPALGHDESSGGAGFVTGLLHPALGFDHLLAMLCVGILSVQVGGQAIWYIPGAFVGVMIFGGYLGMNDYSVPAVESGIAMSVLVLGAAIMFGNNVSRWIALICVGVFAVFHGHAHGTEMPLIADPLFYGLGFVSGTAVIHLTGVSVGFLARRNNNGHMKLRYGGVMVSLIGTYFLVSGFIE